MSTQIISYIPTNVILALNIAGHTTPIPVYIGQSNIDHMSNSHPADYSKYFANISDIIANPDYAAINTKDNSIELVKECLYNGEYVKVAVRISATGKYFARSLYVLKPSSVANFIAKGTLIKI